MSLSDLLEKIGRTVFEGPFESLSQVNDSPEVAEIRFALLDEIKRKTQRAGGRDLFAYNLIRIRLSGLTPSDCVVFEGEFFRRYFGEEARNFLERTGCRHPGDLAVEVRAQTEREPAGWVQVEASVQECSEHPPEPPRRTAAKIVVTAGKANVTELALSKTRTNIGRVLDVYKSAGLTRRNDLVFEEEDAVNRTVSREHAHILYDKAAGEYRLFNDRFYQRGNKTENHCGIWIMRNGMGQEVHRDNRGTKLEAGDEIHLGRAVLEFRCE